MLSFSRREFLAASGLLAASSNLTAHGTQEPAPAAPSESVTLGFIGVGGMGSGLLNIFKGFPDVRIAAVCDVCEGHALRAKEAAVGKPEVYRDFRQVLDRKDIDAVVIATPDHWHAITAIMACQAGKDVYCEKPLAYTIHEGNLMAQAARKHGRMTQTGNLIHAGENYHRMVEIVQSGVLGRIPKVRIWMSVLAKDFGTPPDSDPPADLDYDFWLGPAPKRAYNLNRCHFTWRYFWDYGGGWLADFICHLLDPVHWAMGVTAPQRITAAGDRYVLQDNSETPDTFEVIYHYPDKNFELVWSHQSHSSHGFEGRGSGIMFLGEKATLHGHYNDFEVVPAKKGEEIGLPEPSLTRSPGHHRDWLNSIKTREPASCNFDYGQQLSAVGHMGNIAFKLGETLEWDASTQQFVNNERANAMLRRELYRAPWTLPVV